MGSLAFIIKPIIIMKKINIYKLLCAGLVAAFIGIGFQADGQIGNLKKLKGKAEKTIKSKKKDEPEKKTTTTKTSGSSTSNEESSGEYDGPAKYAIHGFNRNCNNMQKFVDEGIWGGGQTGKLSFGRYLEMAKTELDKIPVKDPAVDAAPYQERYDGYKAKWDAHEAGIAQKKKEEEDAKIAAENAKWGIVKDDGIANETHKKYVKKIVFSNPKLNYDESNLSAIKTTFKIGEPLFRRVFLEKSLGNYYRGYNLEKKGGKPDKYWRFDNDDGVITWKYYLDGKLAFEEYQRLRTPYVTEERIDEWTSWWTELVPAKEDRYHKVESPVRQLGELLAFMAPGTHKIKIEAWVTDPVIENKGGMGEIEIMADGEFTISFTAQEQVNYRKKRGVIMPAARKSDPALEKKMLSTFKTAYPLDIPLRAVITQGVWSVHRHNISGIILSRTMDATVAVKIKDGTCLMHTVVYKQIHEGSSYGRLQVSLDTFNTATRIGCGEVNIKQ